MSFKALLSGCLFKMTRNAVQNQPSTALHTSLSLKKAEDRKEMLASMPAKDEGTAGEKSVDIDSLMGKKERFFPDTGTATQLFNGLPFNELPVAHVRVSPNNTIISFTDCKGVPRLIRSCGIEGFKNTRKGTNIAAQATAISIGSKAVELGWKTIRVKVRGLGPGRMLCDHELKIRCVDSSHPGACHDSFIWNSSDLKTHFEQKYLQGETNN